MVRLQNSNNNYNDDDDDHDNNDNIDTRKSSLCLGITQFNPRSANEGLALCYSKQPIGSVERTILGIPAAFNFRFPKQLYIWVH